MRMTHSLSPFFFGYSFPPPNSALSATQVLQIPPPKYPKIIVFE